MMKLSSAVFGALLITISLTSSDAYAMNLIANGGFATGDFTGWSLSTTGNGDLGPSPLPKVSSFNVTGAGAANAAMFQVGEANFTRAPEGGSLQQSIFLSAAGTLTFSANVAAYDSGPGNWEAGVFSVLLNGVVESTLDFGDIERGATDRGTLSFSTSVSAGPQVLEILITRPWLNGGDYGLTPFEYVTNISATTGAVPELSTWAMMLTGIAGVGFVGYRRNKAASLAA